MESIALKRLKNDLPKRVDAALEEHALKAEGWATRVRIAFGLFFFAAGIARILAPEREPLFLAISAAWFVVALLISILARRGTSDSLVRLATVVDFTILHLGLVAGLWMGASWLALILFCYFPLLTVASMRYRRSLVALCALYVGAVAALCALLGDPSIWLFVPTFELAALIGFFGSGKPKNLMVGVASKSLQEAFDIGARQKQVELNNLFHEALFPPPQIVLPAIWSSSKHSAGTETGGDYYHIFETDRGPLVVVGDFGSSQATALREVAQLHQQMVRIVSREVELERILAALNLWLVETYQGNRRFSCVIAGWEGEKMRYLNAGHLPVIRLSPKLERSHLPVNCGPLGEQSERRFVAEEIPFAARELLLIYTDGLYLKLTSEREQGMSEIESLIDKFSHGEVNTICHRVFDCAQPGIDEPADDATLVVIRRQPKAAEEAKAQAGGKE